MVRGKCNSIAAAVAAAVVVVVVIVVATQCWLSIEKHCTTTMPLPHVLQKIQGTADETAYPIIAGYAAAAGGQEICTKKAVEL